MSSREEPSGWAIGWTFFAAFMMMLLGGFQIIAGFAAIISDDKFLVTEDLVFKMSVSQWGWVHLILGVVVLLAGLGLFKGAVWARMVGVVLAGLAALSAFAVIPIHPIWGTMIAAVSIAVIWALTAHGRDVADL